MTNVCHAMPCTALQGDAILPAPGKENPCFGAAADGDADRNVSDDLQSNNPFPSPPWSLPQTLFVVFLVCKMLYSVLLLY